MLYVVITRQGYFRFRRRIPDSIRAKIGKTEMLISLNTEDKKLLPSRYAMV